MCLRGKQLLYDRCRERNIPFKRLGKLVVGRNEHKGYLENLLNQCRAVNWPITPSCTQPFPPEPAVPVELISGEEARELEPNLSKDIEFALLSPSTGIVDSHSLMASLEQDIQESENSDIVYATEVIRVDAFKPNLDKPYEDGWVVQVSTSETQDALLARNLINASGLSSTLILNSLLTEQIPMFFARGSYARYNGTSLKASRLIYPIPGFEGDRHSFHSLGTHLTLDMGGNIRFGPDLEFLEPPSSEITNDEKDYTDFWRHHLRPDESRIPQMHEAVSQYLDNVNIHDLSPDYVGIRPKLVGPGAGFSDFTFRTDFSGGGWESDANRGAPMISLLGIESPGLTSCLALGEYLVEKILLPLQT